MATTGKELVRQADIDAATGELRDMLRRGDARAASTAIARYDPPSQALVVRTTYLDERQPRAGESKVDALNRAGQAAERVIELVSDESAPSVVAELDPETLGAVLASAAGQPTSTVAQLVDPQRIEKLLATSLELWTVAPRITVDAQIEQVIGVEAGMRPQQSKRPSGLNVDLLVHVLWTLFQTDDERAIRFLAALNPDLVAYPIARALVRVPTEDAEAAELDEEQPDDPFEAALMKRRSGEGEGPEALGIEDSELRDLLDRIFELGRDAYQRIIRRARTMDLHEVREELIRAAKELASGEEADVAAGGTDEMFTPLDPRKGS